MSLLVNNSLPAERSRGLVFSELFENNNKVVLNEGTITGAPVINFGCTFDGSADSLAYPSAGVFNSTTISIEIEFFPDFDTDDNATTAIFSTTTGGTQYSVKKLLNSSSNVLLITLGDTTIESIAEATYSPFWNVGSRNVLIVTGDADNNLTNVWLNNNQILTNDSTAWSAIDAAQLFIGSNPTPAQLFDGKISLFRVYNTLLTAGEVADIQTNSTFNPVPILDLTMGMAQHDPTGVKTLDVSGSGADATFGDGSTSTTYPTKLTGKGYSYDGGDYLRTANIVSSLTTGSVVVEGSMGSVGTNQVLFSYETNGGGVGFIVFYVANTSMSFFSGGAGGGQNASMAYTNTNERFIVVGVYDGTNTKIYLNGVEGTDAASPAAPSVDGDSVGTVGARANLITDLANGGKVNSVQMYDFAFTPTQVQDSYVNFLKKYNDI